MDIVDEGVTNLKSLELKLKDELTKQMFDPFLTDWIRGPYREELTGLLKNCQDYKNRGIRGQLVVDTHIKLAQLQNELAFYLHLVSRNKDVGFQMYPKLLFALLGKDEDSVINCLGPNNQVFVETELYGTISNLTLWDLLERSGRGLTNRLTFSRMVAPSELDVNSKIDVVLSFGDVDNDRRKIIRVLQLKTHNTEDISMERIYEDDIRRVYSSGIDRKQVELMIQGAKQLFDPRTHHIMYFLLFVPNFRLLPVSNILGILNTKYPLYNQMLINFYDDAIRCGLIPKYE